MRNLKRVLSLALASAMLFSMMVIGAGAADKKAADLTDMDKVVNKDAVNLMVDLKIIEGKPDGSFAPTETVDRATMAKLVYKVLQGDSDESVFKGTGALKDVTGHWAEGFINYCYSIGIIAGDGTGNFLPGTKVSTVGAAKMMLVALGYDAADRGYVNDSQWSVNIMKDAQSNGLLKGIDQKATDELTRDNAAQMLANTLFAKTRTPEYDRDMGEKYIKSYTVNPTTLGLETYGLMKYVLTVDEIKGSTRLSYSSVSPKVKTSNDSAKVITAATSKDSGLVYTADMVATNVAVYVKVTYELTNDSKEIDTVTYKSLYSSSLVAADTTVLGSSTDGTPINGYAPDATPAIKKDLTTKNSQNKGFIAELYKDGNDVKVTSILNGEVKSNGAATVHADVLAAAKTVGAVVELIDTKESGKADVVKVTVKKVATLTGDATTRTSNDVLEVKVPGVVGAFTEAANVVGYEGLKKDDVVLYTKVGDVYHIEKAAMVEGIVTATNKDGAIYVDGTYYPASGLVSNVLSGWDDWSNTYKFYLDNGKNVIKTEQVTNETSNQYAVILDAKWVEGSTLDASNYAQAKLLLSDGTTQVVTVSKMNGTTLNKDNKGAPLTDLKPDNSTIAYKFFTYLVDSDGKYELKTVSNTTVVKGNSITNNATNFDSSGSIGNSNTVFMVASKDGDKNVYKSYTGIANVPSATLTNASFDSAMITKDNVATYVFLNAKSVTGVASDATYFYVGDKDDYTYYPKTTSNTTAYYQYAGYIDGSEATIKTDELLSSNALYKVNTKNDAGIYTSFDEMTSKMVTGIKVASGGTLQTASDSKTYTYDSGTDVYFVNTDGEMSSGSGLSVDQTNQVLVLTDGKGFAETVYVIEVIGKTSAATVKYTVAGTAGTNIEVASGNASATGTVTGAANAKVVFTVESKEDATYTISSKEVTIPATGSSTVTVDLLSEDGKVTSKLTITVSATGSP